MEIATTTYASPAALTVARHRMAPTAQWTAYGLEAARVLAPVSAAFQGTTVSIAGCERTRAMGQVSQIAATKATALLPISDVAVVNGFGGRAGIRTSHNWSPPV